MSRFLPMRHRRKAPETCPGPRDEPRHTQRVCFDPQLIFWTGAAGAPHPLRRSASGKRSRNRSRNRRPHGPRM